MHNGNGAAADEVPVTITSDEYDQLRREIRLATAASRTAANAALEASAACNAVRNEVLDAMANQTGEILRLIGSDAATKARTDALDRHVQSLLDHATAAIQASASRAGSGLTRKVTIPVGAIASAVALVQWLMQHWPHGF